MTIPHPHRAWMVRAPPPPAPATAPSTRALPPCGGTGGLALAQDGKHSAQIGGWQTSRPCNMT